MLHSTGHLQRVQLKIKMQNINNFCHIHNDITKVLLWKKWILRVFLTFNVNYLLIKTYTITYPNIWFDYKQDSKIHIRLWKSLVGDNPNHIYIYIYIYSALQKYWNSKDKIALLAVESIHLQILLKKLYSRNCHQIHWVVLHIASEQWPKTPCHFSKLIYKGKEMESLR